MNKDLECKLLRLSFPLDYNIDHYDTATYRTAAEYTVLEHLFSTLLKLDHDGNIELGLAKDYGWQGESQAYITLKDNLKTSLGNDITIYDVELSIKRLLVLSSNTHAKIHSILRDEYLMTSINDKHPSITVCYEDNKIVFDLKKKLFYFFDIFTNVDYAIIHSSVINLESLNITNYKNTTGPYYYDGRDENNNITLTSNKNSNLYNNKMPQVVKLVCTESDINPMKLLENDEVDMIGTDSYIQDDIAQSYQIRYPESDIHFSHPMKLIYFKFSEKCIERTTTSQRIEIVKKIKKEWESSNSNKFITYADQIFPNSAAGTLDQCDLDRISKLYNENYSDLDNIELKIYVSSVSLKRVKSIFEKLKWLKILTRSELDANMSDLISSQMDINFSGDVSFVGHIASNGMLGLRDKYEKWISDYMNTDDIDQRAKMLKNQHYNVITEASIIPLYMSCYKAICNSKWKMYLSKQLSNTQLWKLVSNL